MPPKTRGTKMKYAAVIAACIGFAGAAAAQDTGWEYGVSIYGWLPAIDSGLETQFGTVHSKLEMGDVLDALDTTFQGTFEARRNGLGLIADLVYSDLSSSNSFGSSAAFSGVRSSAQMTLLSGYALYTVNEEAGAAFDVGAGLRYYSTDIEFRLESGLVSGRKFRSTDEWVDPVIAARLRFDLGDRWFGTALVDLGGFGVGSEMSHQAALTLGYELTESWSLRGGYRYLDFTREMNGRDVSMEMSGPLVGATFKF